LPGSVLAAIGVTPATGGSAISADTNSVDGTGAYTTLTGPVVNGTAGDLDAGTVIFTIDDAAEFAFNLGTGSASLSGAGCGTLDVGSGPTVVAASVTLTLTGDSSGTCNVTFSGLQVRPTAAGAVPLETSGITASGTAGATGAAGTLTVVPGTAILDFTQGTIGDAAAGANLSPQPSVHSEDQYSNARAGDSIALSIKAGTGSAGAILSCTTNPVVTDGGGDADFAGCDIDKSGTGYILVATGGGDTAESNAFNINAGPATKLFFFQQPSRGTLTGGLTTQPIVDVQDASGNRVIADDTTVVTLELTTGTGTLTCTGGLSKAAVDGRATFTGCSISAVGVGKVITATSAPVLTPAVSSAFDVADRLVFTTQPDSSQAAGVALDPQPVVAVRANTVTATNDDATVVTLSIKAGTGATGATLTCTGGLSKTVTDGVATFSGCAIDKISPTSPANPYKIVATAANLTSAESTNVAITAGPASKLGFTAQPNGGVASQAFPIQPVVAVQDAGGNTVTSGTNSTATVTLSLAAGAPAGSVLSCTGGLAKTAVAGVATFAGCAINAAGTYRLVATATTVAAGTTIAPVTGNSFTVTAPTAAITLTTSAPIPPGAQNPVILWGQGFTLGVQFGANGASKQFQLQGTRDLITWTTITTLTTDANGRASLFYTPVTNLYYRAVFAGTPDLAAANSNQVRTVVRQLAVLRPTSRGAIKTISRNSSITFTTTVRPARPELAPAQVSFYLYKRVNGVWTRISTRNVFIDGAGLARTTWKFASTGDYYVRSQANPTTYNANSVMSPLERYNVR
jgi:hypothetical protein